MYTTLYAAARFLTPFAASLTLAVAPFAALARQTPAPAAPPPQDEDEVVRVSTELVQTDVMVFDREGKFVEGLSPEQFELKVDGQPQPISFFDRVEAGTLNEDAQLAAARGGARATPAAAGAAVPLDRGRTVGFFVDDLHLSPEGAVSARRALQRFVEQGIGQNDMSVIASASGRIGFLQQYTTHKAVLRAAVGRVAAGPGRGHDNDSPPMSEFQAVAVERNDTALINVFVTALLRENPGMRPDSAENLIRSRARLMVERMTQKAAVTLQSLESFVRRSAPLPGRKILFFISEGFIFDERNSQMRDRLRRITDAAARSGLVIYTMDAQGLRTNNSDPASAALWVVDVAVTQALSEAGDIGAYQAPLRQLAADTGGRALVNTNALGAGVTAVLKETAKYYLLAWRPAATENKGDPKFRRIEVSVKGRKDLRVLVRRGFYSTPPEPLSAGRKKEKERNEKAPPPAREAAPGDRDLQAALSAPLPVTGLPTALSLGYTNTAEAGTVLTSAVELSREALILMTQGRSGRQHFDILGAVFDADGKVVKGFRQDLSFAGQLTDTPDRTRVVTSHQVPLAPGLYQVRVAARDRASGRTGSAAEWVEIPDLKQEKFALGSVFLAERVPEGAPGVVTVEGLGATIMICADRRFARTSWLRFLTHVYSTEPAPAAQDLALQVQILRDDQPVFTAPLRKISLDGLADRARVPYAAELTLSDFPAGHYVLQVTGIDRASKQTSTQRVAFAIE